MSSITAEYVIVNCQPRAKYRRQNDGKVTGFAITTTEEYPELDAETLQTEILVPHISREGKKRIKEVFSDEQGVDMKFDYIKREKAEKKYLQKEEAFSVPPGKSLARITMSGLPAETETSDFLATIDTILGFPNYKAEKPSFSS
jgi:hypothetical protein